MNVLTIGNKKINLPKMTLGVKEQIDSINESLESDVVTDRDKYQQMLDFVTIMVGEDAARQLFESDKLDDIDLPTIQTAYLGICNAFDRPQLEAQAAQRVEKLNTMLSGDTMKQFNEILKVADAMKGMKLDGNSQSSVVHFGK